MDPVGELIIKQAVSEVITRRHENGTTFWRARKIELRLGHPDDRFGWVLWPSRTTVLAARGAIPVSYAVDAWGDRAASDQGGPDAGQESVRPEVLTMKSRFFPPQTCQSSTIRGDVFAAPLRANMSETLLVP